jgi:hypothetical protein
MWRERRIAVTMTVLYLAAAALLFVLVFRTTGVLWWRWKVDRRVDPPPALRRPAADAHAQPTAEPGR